MGSKTGVDKLIAKSHRWQLTAVAVAALIGLWGTHASALSLGRISVQSALGEPLKAEIEILDINAEETATLSAKVASPETFRKAVLDYNTAMTSLQATLQRRTNGRAYIKLSSDRAINDPFVDMILEASWNTGRIVRDYTMLFDPPSLRSTVPTAPTPAQVPVAVETRPANQAPASTPSIKPTPGPASPPVAAKAEPVTQKAKPLTPEKPATPNKPAGSQTVTIKAGDTAGRLAAINKSTNVSLDQMLVALLRSNPDAFIGDNVNRIKAGAIVTLPTPDQASETPTEQASQIIVAQSRDFNDFRRQLASSVPSTPVAAAGRTASGKIQARVEEKKTTTPAPDKLTLSKGAVSSLSAEDQLAQASHARDAANRTAELAKNIQDLSKLATASGTQIAAGSAPSSSAAQAAQPALPVTLPTAPVTAASVAASAPTPTAAASAPASTPSGTPPTAVASSAATASAPQKPASMTMAPPAPVDESDFVDALLENPLLPVGAAGLIALLVGLGIYKVRQRKKAATLDSAFVESRLQPESFFGASGGQNVDTNDNPATGSSMVYSPSQLDAVDDVDPVAEADVYMAYGRDLQAEEILKDALRSNPNRLAIHQKLLEIYTKRRDAKAFEGVATLAFNLTNGTGTDWEQVCEKGLEIDPDNALYLPGGQPLGKFNAATSPAELEATQAFAADHTSPDFSPEPVVSPTELDLDLDFSLEDAAPAAGPNSASDALHAAPAIDLTTPDEPEPLPTLSMNFTPPASETKPAPAMQAFGDGLDFSMPDLDSSDSLNAFDKTPIVAAQTTPPHQAANLDSGMLEFDLGSLSLDLGEEPITESGALPNTMEDPLETKLALAEEFKAIGDDDGARSLIEEVIAEAFGDMKSKAQRALGRL